MTALLVTPWSPPRWLRFWAIGTLALLFVLLTLGAVVTSFRVGMADPIWPTRPWHLFTIDWSEPKSGFLIEHSHRLAGFLVGGAVALLALGLWYTERNRALRWGGISALVVLLGAFGQLHGTLIQHQRAYQEAQSEITSTSDAVALPQPDWRLAAGPTTVGLALVAVFALIELGAGSVGRGLRVVSVILLVAVMVQGMFGGLRVYLNALLGVELATIHGINSQIVLALAVGLTVTMRPQPKMPADDRMPRSAARAAVITAMLVFAQVVAGAILRHTSSPMGPRLHLLLAFVVLSAVIVTGRVLRDASTFIRGLKIALHTAIGLQLLLGIETWIAKYKYGFSTAPMQAINAGDAVLRTSHAVMGYGVFALAVALAVAVERSRPATVRINRRSQEALLEVSA